MAGPDARLDMPAHHAFGDRLRQECILIGTDSRVTTRQSAFPPMSRRRIAVDGRGAGPAQILVGERLTKAVVAIYFPDSCPPFHHPVSH